MRNQENKPRLHETEGARFRRDFRNRVNSFLSKFQVMIAGIEGTSDKEGNHGRD